MPESPDRWEQEFQPDNRARRLAKLASGRTWCPAERAPGRPRNRSPDPAANIAAYAERLRWAWTCQDGAGRPPLLPEPTILRHLAYCCAERSDLLGEGAIAAYTGALIALSAHWRDWVRAPEGWEPPEGDAGAQFGSLTRHLLARYEVPRFMDAAWRAGLSTEGVTWQGWFKQIGRGSNIRSAHDLPIPLTRRMAHHFLQAPPDLDIPAAFRYAQVLGLGGDERLARSLLGTRIGTDFRDHDFWEPVIRWFVAHPSVAPMHHGPIIDYLHDQKFVPSVPNPASRMRGQQRQPLLVPPQPNLCMRGRTPDSLLRAVEQWHKRLGTERKGACVEWKPSGIPPFTCEVGAGADRKVYAITELISSGELEEEGAAMGHCVASYWMLCASGQSSIWSVTVEDASGRVARLLTLEVRNGQRQIVQARRESNFLPTEEERALLARWADVGGPSLCWWLIAALPMEIGGEG